MKAALVERGGEVPIVVDDVEIEDPRPGFVRVRVHHCGLCHSDLTMFDAPTLSPVPMILGHEAAGVVERVGAGVTSVSEGDHVVLVALAPCGRCYWCVRGEATICERARQFSSGLLPDGTTALSRRGAPVYRGLGVGGFGEQTITTENGVVKIDADIPLDIAAVVGCALQTGVGAVLNAARVVEGATVLVMGLGGIGISVVQGARVAGASRVIVSDPNGVRRDAAAHFGATDALDPTECDVVAEAHRLTNGVGVDYAFDAAGSVKLVETGLAATRVGGTTVMVGAPDQMTMQLNAMMHLVMEKKLIGTLYGSGNPARTVPMLFALWRRGALDLESMVSFRRPIGEIGAALDDLRNGRGIRTVLSL